MSFYVTYPYRSKFSFEMGNYVEADFNFLILGCSQKRQRKTKWKALVHKMRKAHKPKKLVIFVLHPIVAHVTKKNARKP